MKYIIVFGVGKYGRKLQTLLMKMNIAVDYFVVTSPEKEYVAGVPIISIRDLKMLDGEKWIFIMLRDCEIRFSVLDKLITEKIDNIHFIDGIRFVEDNDYLLAEGKSGDKYCPLCMSKIERFEPGGADEEIFKRHRIIGGGYREGVICPNCGSYDRERWIYWVLKNRTTIFSKKCSVLHIAPEKGIEKWIRQNVECDYYSGDIQSGRAMHVVDVTNLQFVDNFFDYIIMNHVLEHIEEEVTALQELHRVLKNNGKMILSFPICMDMDTFEDSTVKTKEQRLWHYGQEDHVRLYGKDFKTRIENTGLFKVDVLSPERLVDAAEIKENGYVADDITIVCTKICMADLEERE